MSRRWITAVAVLAVAIGLAMVLGRGREGEAPAPAPGAPIPAANPASRLDLPPAPPAKATAAAPGTQLAAGSPPAAQALPPGAVAGSTPVPVPAGSAGSPSARPEQVEPPTFAADRDGIRESMELARQDVDVCYQAWLKQNPKIQGKTKLHYVIAAADGRPREVSLESDLHHTALEGCIVSAVQALHFERPQGDLTINYPYTFEAAAP